MTEKAAEYDFGLWEQAAGLPLPTKRPLPNHEQTQLIKDRIAVVTAELTEFLGGRAGTAVKKLLFATREVIPIARRYCLTYQGLVWQNELYLPGGGVTLVSVPIPISHYQAAVWVFALDQPGFDVQGIMPHITGRLDDIARWVLRAADKT